MASKIFVDTSAFFAYFDSGDSGHGAVAEFMDESKDDFCTSNYVVDELVTLFRYRNFSVEKIRPFIEELLGETFCRLYRVTPEIERAAWEMMIKYDDHRLSFTDCTSFIIMRANSIEKACSMDQHFRIAGFLVFP